MIKTGIKYGVKNKLDCTTQSWQGFVFYSQAPPTVLPWKDFIYPATHLIIKLKNMGVGGKSTQNQQSVPVGIRGYFDFQTCRFCPSFFFSFFAIKWLFSVAGVLCFPLTRKSFVTQELAARQSSRSHWRSAFVLKYSPIQRPRSSEK